MAQRFMGAKARYWGLAGFALAALVAVSMSEADGGVTKPEGQMSFVCYRDGIVAHHVPAKSIQQRVNEVTGGEHWTVELDPTGDWSYYAPPDVVCGPEWPHETMD